jgi:hypothetical protein
MSAQNLDFFAAGLLTEELTLAGQSVTDHAPLIAARLDAQAAAAELDARQIPLPEPAPIAPEPAPAEPEADDEPTGRATYSPEDNKLRLYIGRVPRPEYEALRAEGWKALHKQREAGGGDFVATWTPARRDTALDYAAVIEDEDMGPAERAADRAERFAGYREKRTAEATGTADKFDAGPAAHGFQSQARAERAARRHDRTAGRAVDAWDKAEYWQRRTAGVISHALHACSPSVRMGRIKELEADLRRHAQNGREDDWTTHYRLRLAYEEQMIEAQGGRAGAIEIEKGGTWRGGVVAKVNKSPATGRVVSVCVIVPRVEGWHYKITNEPGTPFALMQDDTERADPAKYTPPTEASRAKLAEFETAKKDAAAKRKAITPPCPLVNPTDADAERLQALWNAQVIARGERRKRENRFASSYCPELEGEQSQVLRITQANYSAVSGGTYGNASTTEIEEGGNPRTGYRGQYKGTVCCKLRTASGETYKAERVIVITDKPQKPFPAAVWAPVSAPETVPA